MEMFTRTRMVNNEMKHRVTMLISKMHGGTNDKLTSFLAITVRRKTSEIVFRSLNR